MALLCTSCGAGNDPGDSFCVECGSPLSSTCPSCGAPTVAGKRFCGKCGTRLGTADPPSPDAQGSAIGGHPVAERRVTSVLFADLVGFTTLSESRDAEQVRELLSQYFVSARTIVARYGGVVEKFIGDAVMAVWGTPTAREDDAERCVRAALELVDAVAAFGESVGAPGLRARAGVVTGEVAVTLGATGEGMVAGDPVNTAARLQTTADPGTVLVDDATRGLTRSAISYVDAGEHRLKGKAQPVRLYAARAVVAAVGGAQRVDGLEASFLGRDRELRLVKEHLHDCVERGTARLLAVTGTAGVGKSRLAWEFFKYVDGLADTVLWHLGRCLSYGDGVAFWALAQMVRQRCGIAEDEPPAAAEAKLAAALERWIPAASDRDFLAPRLAALLGIAEPGLAREELFAGWRLFFVRLADQAPVVLVIEDAQHADPGLLDFVEHLLDWAAEARIFVLTLARPELEERRAGWGAGRRNATTLHLEPLPAAAMTQLIDELVADLPRELRDQIVTRAEGVPLYAVETIRSLIDRDVVVPSDGVYRLVGEVAHLDTPPSLSALLAARIDALPEGERALVRNLSVLGATFPRTAVSAVSSLAPAELDALLAILVRKEILTLRADPLSPDRGQYAFTQALLRTVAYDTLARRDRKQRHLAVAAHLHTAGPDEGGDVADVIAAHYAEAYRAAPNDPDAAEIRAQAVEAYRKAGDRSLALGAPETALAVYRSAAELAADEGDRAELTGLAGEAASRAGRHADALELLEQAIAAHTDAGRTRDASRLAPSVSQALLDLGRNDEGIRRLERALESIDEDAPDADVAALAGRLGLSLVFAAQIDQAWPRIETALIYAQALELPDVLCEALDARAIALTASARHDEALISFEGAAAIADERGLSRMMSIATGNAADLRLTGDLPGAREKFEIALRLARRRGDRMNEAVALANLLLVQIFSGEWVEAERLATEALANPDRPGAADLHNRLALISALRGEGDIATRHLGVVSDAWEHVDDMHYRAMLAATQGTVALAVGDNESALTHASNAVDIGSKASSLRHEAVRQAWPDAVEAAVRLGRNDVARRCLDSLARLPRGHVPPYLRAQHSRYTALQAAASGRGSDVEPAFAVAEARLSELGYPYWLACTRLDHAAWLAQTDADRAAELAEQATATFAELGATAALAGAGGRTGFDPALIARLDAVKTG